MSINQRTSAIVTKAHKACDGKTILPMFYIMRGITRIPSAGSNRYANNDYHDKQADNDAA